MFSNWFVSYILFIENTFGFTTYILNKCWIVHRWFPRSKSWDNTSIAFTMTIWNSFLSDVDPEYLQCQTPQFSREPQNTKICVSSRTLNNYRRKFASKMLGLLDPNNCIFFEHQISNNIFVWFLGILKERLSSLSTLHRVHKFLVTYSKTLQGLLSIWNNHLLMKVTWNTIFAIAWWPISYYALAIPNLKYLSLGVSPQRIRTNV